MHIKKNVLLTGARSLFTLDLARRFHEQGHRVYAAETTHFHVCRFSNTITKSFITPSPRFQPEKFIHSLLEIVQDVAIDILIPSFEEIFYLSQGLDQFPPSCTVFCSPHQILDVLHNKWYFNQKIAQMGFATPQSQIIRSSDDLANVSLPYPYILKPCYSRAAQRILKITSPPPKLAIDPLNPLVAQEWLHGEKFCSHSISHQGHLTSHVTYPVDFSIGGNASLNFEAVAHKGILECVQTFVKKENFTGQIAFDFIELPKNRLYAIECNPRGTSGIHLFQKRDNLPEAFLNPTLPTLFPSQGFSKQITWGMMLYGWKTLPPGKTFFHFLKKFLSLPDVIFSLKDLKPFLFQPILFLAYTFKSLKLKTHLTTMFTFDTDWNGQALTHDKIP